MTDRTYRAGDTVFVPAIDEEWLLACDEDNGMVVCCGWPESWVKASEVELREAASDQARLSMLFAVSKIGGARASLALRQIGAEANPSAVPVDADQDGFTRAALGELGGEG